MSNTCSAPESAEYRLCVDYFVHDDMKDSGILFLARTYVPFSAVNFDRAETCPLHTDPMPSKSVALLAFCFARRPCRESSRGGVLFEILKAAARERRCRTATR